MPTSALVFNCVVPLSLCLSRSRWPGTRTSPPPATPPSSTNYYSIILWHLCSHSVWLVIVIGFCFIVACLSISCSLSIVSPVRPVMLIAVLSSFCPMSSLLLSPVVRLSALEGSSPAVAARSLSLVLGTPPLLLLFGYSIYSIYSIWSIYSIYSMVASSSAIHIADSISRSRPSALSSIYPWPPADSLYG